MIEHEPRIVDDISEGAARSTPILIGGQRRSGTTLMRTMLRRHPHIACVPESHFFQASRFEQFFRDLLAERAELFRRLGVGPAEMDSAVAVFVNALFEPYRMQKGAQRWAEKSPENALRIDYLFRLFPQAQFIHMIRDPRDTLASMKEQARSYKPNWAKFTAPVTAPEWVDYIHSGERWRDRPELYLEIQYEHLVRDPVATMERVLDYLGEPWTPTVLSSTGERGQSAKGGNDHKPIFTTSVGRWRRDLSEDEVTCIETVAGSVMISLGYEL